MMTYLRIDELHDRLLKIFQIDGVLGRRPRNDVVVIIVVTAQGRKLLSVRELDVNAIFLHDALNAPAADTDDALVIGFWDMERDFGRQFLLQER